MKGMVDLLAVSFILFAFSAHEVASSSSGFYSLSAENLEDNITVPLEKFNGMVSLVVNVASECGYTDSNYKELVNLQNDYNSSGFNVLAFPCNQFDQQEPGTSEDIKSFARDKYGVNFPMFSKTNVFGEEVGGVYEYLIENTWSVASWNFCKYLVDRHGDVVQFFSVKEEFSQIRHSIEYLLSKSPPDEL